MTRRRPAEMFLLRLSSALSLTVALIGVTGAQSEAPVRSPPSWKSVGSTSVEQKGDTTILARGTIRTDQVFSDFTLRFELRLPEPSSKAAVFVRSRFNYGATSEIGYSISASQTRSGDSALGRISAVRVKMRPASYLLTPTPEPATWQRWEVRAERHTITVRINGQVVSETGDVTEPVGYIAVRNLGRAAVELRNVKVERKLLPLWPVADGVPMEGTPELERPKARNLVKTFYPQEAADLNVRGMVVVEFIIEENGSVTYARVTEPIHPDLDEVAVAALRMSTFQPGRLGGQPVRVRARFEQLFVMH